MFLKIKDYIVIRNLKGEKFEGKLEELGYEKRDFGI